MAASWGDPRVTRALGDVVARLGRRALVDPARLQEELIEQLGGITGGFTRQIDALVVAAEESVPEGMLAGASALDLSDWLDERGMPPEAAGWVLSTWGRVIAEERSRDGGWADQDEAGLPAEPSAGPSAAARPLALVEPVAEPEAREAPKLPPVAEAPVEPAPSREPGPPLAVLLPAHTPASTRRRRLVGAAAGLIVVLAIGVAGVTAFGGIRGDGKGPQARPALPATTAAPGTTGASPGVALTASAPGSLTGGVVVLARAGGTERFPPGTAPAFLDAVKAQAPKGLRAAATGDLRWTSDDVPVLVEDPRISPPMYCAKRYVVARATWASLLSSCLTQASASPDGRSYPVASLSSTLQRVSAVDGAQLYLEIKTPLTRRQRQTLVMQLDQMDMTDRVVIGSFRPADLAPFRPAAATAPPSASTSASGSAAGGTAASLRLILFTKTASPDGATARRNGYWAVAVRRTAMSRAYVQDMHAFGVRVAAWNIDERPGWIAARSAGVDIVVSDTPRAYLSWAAAR